MKEHLHKRAVPLTVVLAAGGLLLEGCASQQEVATTASCQVFMHGSSAALSPRSLPEAWPTGQVSVAYYIADTLVGQDFNNLVAPGTVTYDPTYNAYSLVVDGLPVLPSPGLDAHRTQVLGAADLSNSKNAVAALELNDKQGQTYELSSGCIAQTINGGDVSDVVSLPIAPQSIMSPMPTPEPSATS